MSPALLGRHLVGSSRFNLYRHTRLIAAKVAEAAMTPNGRLIIVMPPRYGKTLLTSILLPLWFLECFPDKRVILASYAAELSRLNSREARNLIASYPDRLRLRLAQDSKAAYRWNSPPEGGGLLSTGVDGTMTGFGAHLVCLDDLYKDWRSAHSPTVRQGTWDWYRSVPRQRLEPGASIVVTMTRWHEEDLVGQILTGADDEDPYPWQVLRLPAVAEPTHEEPDPLGRAEGEVLCPERFDEVAVHSAMRDAGPYLAAGMFQQRPAAREGTMFRAQRWGDAPALPASLRGLVRWWDLAATEGAGDYKAGSLVLKDENLVVNGGNLIVRNGLGGTDTTNGAGNVIIGYNEFRVTDNARSGSHMLVLGSGQNFTSYGGIVAGHVSSATAPYACVLGGYRNTAEGESSVVVGGTANTASALYAAGLGGEQNASERESAAVVGGRLKHAQGLCSVAGGGEGNAAIGPSASVAGGTAARRGSSPPSWAVVTHGQLQRHGDRRTGGVESKQRNAGRKQPRDGRQ